MSAKHHPSETTVLNFGCRLNALEGETIRALASASTTKTVVVNTCAVTNEAVRQARQTIRKIRREQPHVQIVATGCAAQIDPNGFAAMDEVDRVAGNSEKLSPAFWAGTEPVRVGDIMAVRETAPHLAQSFHARTRAFLEVQNGCDHRCTFCIIPYGRGPSRSVPMGAIVDRAKALTDAGHQEIVLTGVDLTSYGPDLPGAPRLGDVVQRILAHVPDLARLRLSSIDSVEADDALLEAMESEPRLMPHLHLSLQAGDDMILKRMKRRHLRQDAVAFCDRVRARRPDIVFGADIIAGFPTETDDMFDNTRRIVADCGLTHVHIFPFSPRAGTPAARMPQLPRPVVKARAATLRAEGARALEAGLAGKVGARTTLLVEDDNCGRTPDYFRARLAGPAQPSGTLLPVTITGVEGETLMAAP
ncbi:MAG: tRNA (N(6)-L-threonylcarbamoyladenosine(37)-C(2))-methylthiotransferase MtaB [Pseudomonadota bacterium]